MTVTNLQSLAYKTDLSILAFQGRVEDRGEYVVAESPGNPGYFWGNLLVMKNPPCQGDLERWTHLFHKEFAHQSLVRHMTFGWDSIDAEEGVTEPFLKQGFEVEKSVVLTATRDSLISPKYLCDGLEIRPIKSDTDWEDTIHNQVICRREEFREEKYLTFKRVQMKKYRDMTDAGLGHWFGAFVNGRLVAECGVFIFDGVGRYQSVGTHPEFRRRGICGNLIFESARWAFEHGNGHTLVMSADPEYHAAKVYESVGFKPTQKAIGMYRFPKEEWTRNEE
jgi:RimJ/RimL family protein N-acetyltransferase